MMFFTVDAVDGFAFMVAHNDKHDIEGNTLISLLILIGLAHSVVSTGCAIAVDQAFNYVL